MQENHNYLSEDLTSYYEEIDERTEEEKKQSKIQEINQKAYNEIVEKYPIWKQVNITLEVDKLEIVEELKAFKLDDAL